MTLPPDTVEDGGTHLKSRFIPVISQCSESLRSPRNGHADRKRGEAWSTVCKVVLLL